MGRGQLSVEPCQQTPECENTEWHQGSDLLEAQCERKTGITIIKMCVCCLFRVEWECVGEPVGVGSGARNNHGSLLSGECRSPCVLTLLSVFVIDPFEW